MLRCSQLCCRLKIFALLSPTQAGVLSLGSTDPIRMRLCCSSHTSVLLPSLHLGCCDDFSESPKEDALSRVPDANCAVEFNSCYSAIITHSMNYLVTMARAPVIRFGLLLLLYFKDLSAQRFLCSLKIGYFSICSLQR